MFRRSIVLLALPVALAIGVTVADPPALAADTTPHTTTLAVTPGAEDISIKQVPVKGISGYHGGLKTEMDRLATGKTPVHDLTNPLDGFTLVPSKGRAASYTIPPADKDAEAGRMIHVALQGDYTAVVATTAAGTAPDAIAAAVRAKYHIKQDTPVLNWLGSHKKFLRTEMSFPSTGEATPPAPAVQTLLPWDLAPWASYKRVPTKSAADDLRAKGVKVPGNLAGAIDELGDKCAERIFADYPLCKMGPAKWADVIARSDQVVGAAYDFYDWTKQPHATNTKALTPAQIQKVSDAAVKTVPKAEAKAKIPSKLRSTTKTMTKFAKAAKPWLLNIGVTALRVSEVNQDPNATDMDRAEAYLAWVPFVGETVGFTNAMFKGDAEGMAINTVSFLTLAIGTAFPPAAFAGAAVLVSYAVVKGLMALFASAPPEPPDVKYDKAKNGSKVTWAKGVPHNMTYRWSRNKTNDIRMSNAVSVVAKPEYDFSWRGLATARYYLVGPPIVVKQINVWQDGFPLYSTPCTAAFSWDPGFGSTCEVAAPTVVTPGHPLLIQTLYSVVDMKSIGDLDQTGTVENHTTLSFPGDRHTYYSPYLSYKVSGHFAKHS